MVKIRTQINHNKKRKKDKKQCQSVGTVVPKRGFIQRTPYQHQEEAFKNLSLINQEPSFSTLLVLPTGGGKTYTASSWLLSNALDKNIKILWIAHRHSLLDQAAESFQKYAFADKMPHASFFKYRIVSGSPRHKRSSSIKKDENLLIVSKDSIGANLSRLDSWLEGEKELFLVIDEAHHAAAKTYRKVIDYVRERVPNVKLLGLTATPTRTGDERSGNNILGKIFTDGVRKGKVVKGKVGITYDISLKELLNRQILATPHFEHYETEQEYGEQLGLDAWEKIQYRDMLPEEISEKIAKSTPRNQLIVSTYCENKERYGQTLVFAVSREHAVTLSKLFRQAGIAADYVISGVEKNGQDVSRVENEQKLEDYRSGRTQVLVNVNILTEGVDLPKTNTVFLTRPTVSTILMTQMVGRALRGTEAGGTSEAYIVTFLDKWQDNIAWVTPEIGFEDVFWEETEKERLERHVRLIAIAKIEEFAAIMNDAIDTSELEKVPFSQRIPLGMYLIDLEKEDVEIRWQIMVYDCSQSAYEKMMAALPEIFEKFGVDEEYPSEDDIAAMERYCAEHFFTEEMVPPYDSRDIVMALKYYAQNEEVPPFYSLPQIEREKLDITAIARSANEQNLGIAQLEEYLGDIWSDTDQNLIRLFFSDNYERFFSLVYNECRRLLRAREDRKKAPQMPLEDWTLDPIKWRDPERVRWLRANKFRKSSDGNYCCEKCGYSQPGRANFHVRLVVPRSEGGEYVLENLQLLCRRCCRQMGVMGK